MRLEVAGAVAVRDQGENVSAGDYDDSAEARKRRVEAAKNAKVTVEVEGHPAIGR